MRNTNAENTHMNSLPSISLSWDHLSVFSPVPALAVNYEGTWDHPLITQMAEIYNIDIHCLYIVSFCCFYWNPQFGFFLFLSVFWGNTGQMFLCSSHTESGESRELCSRLRLINQLWGGGWVNPCWIYSSRWFHSILRFTLKTSTSVRALWKHTAPVWTLRGSEKGGRKNKK